MHRSSMDKMQSFRQKHLLPFQGKKLKILDLGSFDHNGSYRHMFEDPAWTYFGADLVAGDGVDVVLPDPYRWSNIASKSFDVVISGQTFEHIEFFWITMLEIRRILKPGGLVCLIAPSAGPEHRMPVDCWRFYADGFSACAAWADMEILECATQWSPQYYRVDDSDYWRDSLLVCRKPAVAESWLYRLRFLLTIRVLRAWSSLPKQIPQF